MLFGISHTLQPATCGDYMIGSETVTVNGGGVCRTGEDTTIAGGNILGPGNLREVYCDDKDISIEFDAIASHPPCPLPPIHCAAFTIGSADVLIGAPVGGVGGGGGSGGVGTVELPDLVKISMQELVGTYSTVGLGWPGPLNFYFIIANMGDAPAPPTKLGLFEVDGLPDPPIVGSLFNLTRNTPETDDKIHLLKEAFIPSLSPGQTFADTITLGVGDGALIVGFPRYFTTALDIDEAISETSEANNSAPLIQVTAT